MIFRDLREFIAECDKLGDCRVVEGADWNLELGLITEIATGLPDSPLLVFDNIKGYSKGYRVATNLFTRPMRTALALGLPLEARGIQMVQGWREKARVSFTMLPPVQVNSGPILENVDIGKDINLYKFPVPKYHELDGGRFIGTGDMIITRDPDEGWVNLGTHRVQVHGEAKVTIHTSPGRHCEMMARKYWKRGEPCPVVVTCGQEPFLWGTCHTFHPWGVSEYDYAGGLRGEPYEVVAGQFTGLPIPANAEIALEGEWFSPDVELLEEGPFGEWPGHYGVGRHGGRSPVMKVKAVYYRNDPIIMGMPPYIPPASFTVGEHIRKAADVWNELDRQVPGVKGVWIVEEAGTYWMMAISLEQRYPGHAKQAALTALGSNAAAYMLKYLIVVDDDVDPSNLPDVLWAICSRTDPKQCIDFVTGCWGSQTDPYLSPFTRSIKDFTHSTAIIMAVKPYHYMDRFPPTIKTTPELLNKTRKKWQHLFG